MILQVLKEFCRTVGRVRSHIPTAIVGIEQFLKDVTVMYIGAGYNIILDKFVFHIYRDVVLVAVESFVCFRSPAGIGIFLSRLVFAPTLWFRAFINLLVYITAVTLNRSRTMLATAICPLRF